MRKVSRRRVPRIPTDKQKPVCEAILLRDNGMYGDSVSSSVTMVQTRMPLRGGYILGD